MKNTCPKTTTSRKKGKRITDSERQIIEKLYSKHVSVARIAYEVAGDLEHKHPHKVKAVREALDELMLKEDEEDEGLWD